jgi:translation initiation factor IF-3
MEALRMAGELDVDLVEIAATADPPVCRLMDYGKFKYQEQKKAAEAKSKQKVIEVKEVKFRPGTDDGDYNIKMRNLRRFIAEDGDKGKVTLRFRGREITHQDIGMRMLERIRDELADVAMVEHMPKLEGRQMIMVLAPKKKVIRVRSRGFRRPLVWSPRQEEAAAGHQAHRNPVPPAGANIEGAVMPKMKTKSSAKKRFRVRPGGTVKRGQAFKRHILTKKTTKNKRHLRGAVNVHETNMGHIAQMLPFAGL